MLCAMVFKRYCKAEWMKTQVFFAEEVPEWAFHGARLCVYIYVAVGTLLIIGTKLHYTLDACIALYATYWTFTHYHSWLDGWLHYECL